MKNKRKYPDQSEDDKTKKKDLHTMKPGTEAWKKRIDQWA